MSTINTRSLIYYGLEIGLDNCYLDFNEGGDELTAVLENGDYSHTEMAVEIARAMSAAGGQEYSCAFSRNDRKFLITAPGDFTLMCASGSHFPTSAFGLLGFDTGSDSGPDDEHTGGFGAAYEYQTQYPVNDYTAPEHSVVLESASTNESPVGIVQQAYFGVGRRIQMNIRIITAKMSIQNEGFYASATGITDFMHMIRILMRKGHIELMPNVADRGTFYKVYLESTKQAKDASKFELLNMKTPDVYESGTLTFREVIET